MFKMKAIVICIIVTFLIAQIAAFNGSASVTSPIINGTDSKDFRIQCDSSSLGLVPSRQRPGVYYLRGNCGGLYSNPHGSRCSFLDLGMCYTNDAGNLRPQKIGRYDASCSNCAFYQNQGSNMLACTCGRGDLCGGGTQETAIQLDNHLFVKNGFLSCYGITNFECPGDNVPY